MLKSVIFEYVDGYMLICLFVWVGIIDGVTCADAWLTIGTLQSDSDEQNGNCKEQI